MSYADVQDAIASIESRRRIRKDLPAFQRFVFSRCPKVSALKIIHIAGTNGKGSTLNYIRSMLNAAGLRVGTLTFSRARLASGPHPHRRSVDRGTGVPRSGQPV